MFARSRPASVRESQSASAAARDLRTRLRTPCELLTHEGAGPLGQDRRGYNCEWGRDPSQQLARHPARGRSLWLELNERHVRNSLESPQPVISHSCAASENSQKIYFWGPVMLSHWPDFLVQAHGVLGVSLQNWMAIAAVMVIATIIWSVGKIGRAN
jgi:hypothetical protein